MHPSQTRKTLTGWIIQTEPTIVDTNRSADKTSAKHAFNMNMARTLYAIGEANGATPTSEQVWLSIRHRDIPKSI